jgi:ACS family sodium-dependent inorganic phosphate cotransporter
MSYYSQQKQKQEEWQLVFFITAAVYLSGAIAFLILGSGETQPWAKKKIVKDVEEGIPLNRK